MTARKKRRGEATEAPRDTTPRVVGTRIDWLETRFRVPISRHALSTLKKTAAVAKRDKSPAPCKFAGCGWEMLPPRSDGRWILRNALSRVEILEVGPGVEVEGDPGWNVCVTTSGVQLLHLGWWKAVGWAHIVAGELGNVLEARFGRMDLCCDVANYDLREDDRGSFVKRRRISSRDIFHDGAPKTKRVRGLRTTRGEQVVREVESWQATAVRVLAEKDAEEGILCAMHAGETFSGFTFGARKTISCRIYDKPLQLRAQPREKREAEFAGWRARGWDGTANVARVEFELRGEALDELKMRHPVPGQRGGAAHAEMLASSLDGVWAYLTRQWLQLVRRGTGEMQPRWRAVQDATFERQAPAVHRERRRSLAKAAQARGAVMGFLAHEGALPCPWRPAIGPDGTIDEEQFERDARDIVRRILRDVPEERRQEVARAKVREWMGVIFALAAPRVSDAELERYGTPEEALVGLTTRWRATLARCDLPAIAAEEQAA